MLALNKTRGFLIFAFVLTTLVLALRSSHPNSIAIPSLRGNGGQPQRTRIMKASMLYTNGPVNEIYQRTLQTQRQHNELHGYEFRVLERGLTGGYWNKLAYLLSLVLGELEKPPEERTEWIMWVDPDTILLNPQVKAEAFLPPPEGQFAHVHLIASKSSEGHFNSGAFFLNVHPWAVKLLVKAMGVPWMGAHLSSSNLGEEALGLVANDTDNKSNVLYLPRAWFHSTLSSNGFDGMEGAMLVKFAPDLEGNKWRGMSDWLDDIDENPGKWSEPYGDTPYDEEIADFWGTIREARGMLWEAEQLTFRDRGNGEKERLEVSAELKGAIDWMKGVIEDSAYDARLMNMAMDRIRKATVTEMRKKDEREKRKPSGQGKNSWKIKEDRRA